jgi:hypothetical protein
VVLDEKGGVISERLGLDVELDKVVEPLAHGGAGPLTIRLRAAENCKSHQITSAILRATRVSIAHLGDHTARFSIAPVAAMRDQRTADPAENGDRPWFGFSCDTIALTRVRLVE